jgi:hypothetical protein
MIRIFAVIVTETFKGPKLQPNDNNSPLHSLKWTGTKIFAAEQNKARDSLK